MTYFHIITDQKKHHMRLHTLEWIGRAIEMTSRTAKKYSVQELEVWEGDKIGQPIVGYIIKDTLTSTFVCGRHAKGAAFLNKLEPPRGYRSLNSAHKAAQMFKEANRDQTLNLVVLGLRVVGEPHGGGLITALPPSVGLTGPEFVTPPPSSAPFPEPTGVANAIVTGTPPSTTIDYGDRRYAIMTPPAPKGPPDHE